VTTDDRADRRAAVRVMVIQVIVLLALLAVQQAFPR
jgi:hypothetical protein